MKYIFLSERRPSSTGFLSLALIPGLFVAGCQTAGGDSPHESGKATVSAYARFDDIRTVAVYCDGGSAFQDAPGSIEAAERAAQSVLLKKGYQIVDRPTAQPSGLWTRPRGYLGEWRGSGPVNPAVTNEIRNAESAAFDPSGPLNAGRMVGATHILLLSLNIHKQLGSPFEIAMATPSAMQTGREFSPTTLLIEGTLLSVESGEVLVMFSCPPSRLFLKTDEKAAVLAKLVMKAAERMPDRTRL